MQVRYQDKNLIKIIAGMSKLKLTVNILCMSEDYTFW